MSFVVCRFTTIHYNVKKNSHYGNKQRLVCECVCCRYRFSCNRDITNTQAEYIAQKRSLLPYHKRKGTAHCYTSSSWYYFQSTKQRNSFVHNNYKPVYCEERTMTQQQQFGDEGRFKVAAATAAVVPFHCVVCFDEFSLKERPPVVLPCGHTYICAPCSKRLKRCMECREPLFITVKHNTQPPSSYNAPRTPILPAPTMYGRYSPTPSTPPQTTTTTSSYGNNGTSQQFVQQIPLALPKNVVLICMMEAAERQMRDANNTNTNSSGTEAVVELIDDTNGSMNASDEDDEYDLNRIISGMATFSGPCGTYAVKERDGLPILHQHPHTSNDNNNEDDDDENVEESRNDEITRTTALHVTASYDSVEVSNPCSLKHGQTVQVVRFENGIATLAREAGYIKATSSQLVKGTIFIRVLSSFCMTCENASY